MPVMVPEVLASMKQPVFPSPNCPILADGLQPARRPPSYARPLGPGAPLACLRAKAICSAVYQDFFME